MKKLIKRKDGVALLLVLIVATLGIMLFTALAGLAFQNYVSVKSSNNRMNAYYVADYGMEKVIRNIETIVESAKTYANQKLRTDSTRHGGITAYDYYTLGQGTKQIYEDDYIFYFNEFIKSIKGLKVINDKYATYQQVGEDVAKARYEFVASIYNPPTGSYYIDDATFKVKITTSGRVMERGIQKFSRQVEAVVGINPWGYTNTGNEGDADLNLNSDIVYSSPQWSSALASDGNINITGGTVDVNGDVYVNGSEPVPYSVDGYNYGGLLVGRRDTGILPLGSFGSLATGTLNVHGNVFSNNYVHTLSPNSKINVKKRSDFISDYNTEINKIYNNPNPNYSEMASNLNDGGSYDPIGIGSDNANLGVKMTKDLFAKYLQDTYKIQKRAGGFVYTNSLEIENHDSALTSDQNINVDGSVILYDNLEVDSPGTIDVGGNYYGFKVGGDQANNSSSIIVNSKDGQINLRSRVYTGGVSWVTEKSVLNGDYYKTADTASIYRNYRAYMDALDPNTVSYTAPSGMAWYDIHQYLTFIDSNPLYPFNQSTARLRHVFAYNVIRPVLPDNSNTQTDGGFAYDHTKIKLLAPGPLYDINKLGDSSVDMGYSEGALIGENASGAKFLGYIKNTYSDTFVKKSVGSLSDLAFKYNIAHKYSVLNEIKALKNDDGVTKRISDLVVSSEIPDDGLIYSNTSGLDANFIAVDGTIDIDSSGATAHANNGATFHLGSSRGLFLATGKITVSSDTFPVSIEGALVSSSGGIEFKGSAAKSVTYNKQILLNIFQTPTIEAQAVKKALTTKRGIIEMFLLDYNNPTDHSFKNEVDARFSGATPEEKLANLAELYEINDPDKMISDKVILYSDVVNKLNADRNKNYQIYSWKTIQ